MKNRIIVGGTMGVGKTATCREPQKILPRNAFLDGDWCWDMRPFAVTGETVKIVQDNIAHLLNNFLDCPEFENVIFCRVLHKQKILDDLIARLNRNGCTIHCFSLVSNEQALSERLSHDIAEGKREPDIIERSVARTARSGGRQEDAAKPCRELDSRRTLPCASGPRPTHPSRGHRAGGLPRLRAGQRLWHQPASRSANRNVSKIIRNLCPAILGKFRANAGRKRTLT